jgi:hypothetical protein
MAGSLPQGTAGVPGIGETQLEIAKSLKEKYI